MSATTAPTGIRLWVARRAAADARRGGRAGARRHRASRHAVAGDVDLVARASLALVVALALQVGVNYANDYSDGVRGTDAERRGPVRLTASGLASPAAVRDRGARSSFARRRGRGARARARRRRRGCCSSVSPRSPRRCSTPAARSRYGYLGLGEVMVLVVLRLRRDRRLGVRAARAGARTPRGGGRSSSGCSPARSCSPTTCATSPTDAATGKRTLAVRLGDAARARRSSWPCVVGAFVAVVADRASTARRRSLAFAARAARDRARPARARRGRRRRSSSPRSSAPPGSQLVTAVAARGRSVAVLTEHRLRIGDRAVTLARGAGRVGRVLAARRATRAIPAPRGARAEEAARRGLPDGASRSTSPVNALVRGPDFDTGRAARGTPAVKVKVRAPDDVDLVARVRDAVGPGGRAPGRRQRRVGRRHRRGGDRAARAARRRARRAAGRDARRSGAACGDGSTSPIAADECVRSIDDAAPAPRARRRRRDRPQGAAARRCARRARGRRGGRCARRSPRR